MNGKVPFDLPAVAASEPLSSRHEFARQPVSVKPKEYVVGADGDLRSIIGKARTGDRVVLYQDSFPIWTEVRMDIGRRGVIVQREDETRWLYVGKECTQVDEWKWNSSQPIHDCSWWGWGKIVFFTERSVVLLVDFIQKSRAPSP